MINVRLTEDEWRLVMKSLAAFAGVRGVIPKAEEQVRAATLNEQLLQDRMKDGLMLQSLQDDND